MPGVASSCWLFLSLGSQLDEAAPPRRAPEAGDIVVVAVGEDGGSDRRDAATLRDMGLRSLGELATRLPNLQIARGGPQGVGHFAIRGIQSSAGAATVTLYLDEVPVQVRPSDFVATGDVQFLDLDHVTLARGPQGTMGGAGALAGEVRLVSRLPDATRTDADMRAEGGVTRFGSASALLSATAGGALAEGRIAVRGAILSRRSGGYIDRLDPVTGRRIAADVDRRDATAARLSLGLALPGGWTVTPALHAQRIDLRDLPLSESDRGPLAQAFVTRQPGRDTLAIGSLAAVRRSEATVLTLVASRLVRDQRQATDYSRLFGEVVLGGALPGIVPAGGTSSRIAVRQRNLTGEVRLASARDTLPLTWTVGVFASRATMAVDQMVVEPGIAALAEATLGLGIDELFGVPLLAGGISYLARERDREAQAALFATVTWRALPTVEVDVGARATRARVGIAVAAAGPYAGRADPVSEGGSRTDHVLTPRIAARWQPDDGDEVRLVAARGFRPGGANTPVPTGACGVDLAALGLAAAPRDYRLDTLWNYELGLRHERRAWRIDYGVFQADWDGIAQQIALPRCGFGFVANAGAARSRGFETSFAVAPLRHVVLSGGIGYTDARFRRTIGPADARLVRRGDRLPFVPRWTGTLAAEAGRPTRRGEARARVEYAFASRYVRGGAAGAAGYEPAVRDGAATHRLDLLLEHRWRRWSATLFAENLADARPALLRDIGVTPASRFPVRETTFRPRTIGIRTELTL